MANSVELLGYYGGDIEHACAAWTSTGGELTEEKKARIPGLLKYLAENNHNSPFERSLLHFRVVCDTASHIHILKHRIGVSVNGESARYKELQEDKFYVPAGWPEESQQALTHWAETGYALYHETLAELEPLLGRKRAKESARFFLPYASQLSLDLSFNFRSFEHFLGLRMKPDAQLEIQQIAQQMLSLVQTETNDDFKYTLEAFGYV